MASATPTLDQQLADWDAFTQDVSHPVADRQADSPRSTSFPSQPRRGGQNTGGGAGLHAFDGSSYRFFRMAEIEEARAREFLRAYYHNDYTETGNA